MGLICHDEDRDANRNAESSGPDRPASIIVGRTSEFSFPPGRLAREEEQFLRWADRRARIPDTDRGDTPLNERQRSEGRGEFLSHGGPDIGTMSGWRSHKISVV